MLNWAIYAMVYLGSALMVYNIYGFVRYTQYIQARKDWGRERAVLYVPLALLVMFLLGYLAVGIFGKPDLIVSGILFGGSIFVFIIFKLLWRITHHIQENEQTEAKLMAAEASNRAKSSFLSNMSHEMRTPMNAIIGLDNIALQDETLTPQTRDRLQKIGISAQHLMDLINDVLDMNLIESGQMTLKHEPFSMREALGLVDLLLQSRCDEKGLEYKKEVLDGVEEVYVGDALRLRQVLLSILGNAVKYTPAPGTVTFTTEQVSAAEDRRELRFTIRDTGIGMEEDFIPRLFDSFTKEDAGTTDRFGGSGLGLAITKRLVDQMGGTIEVQSRKDEGSTFVVTLPLGAAKPPEGSAEEPAPECLPDLEGRRVLIVEDIDLNAEILADLLEIEGAETERAENGQIAVEQFSSHPVNYYDAILMDLRMPVMDGMDATRAIRALDRPDAKTIPIVAQTANAYEEDLQHSLEAGMNEHLSKPLDAERLYDTLRRLIGKLR